ncbi:MAG: HAD hydrolase-like protein [Salinivirgaceae bacterium]|nr:HAD hydrolase-like protein [Salinivirgaceae bacterium]
MARRFTIPVEKVDFSPLVAVVTDLKIYQLALKLGKMLAMDFHLTDSVMSDKGQLFPTMQAATERTRIYIIQNRVNNVLLEPKHPLVNFFVRVESRDIGAGDIVANLLGAQDIRTCIDYTNEVSDKSVLKYESIYINKLNPSQFDVVIFDFGGVILNINPQVTRYQFAQLLGTDCAAQVEKSQWLVALERGEIEWGEVVANIQQIAPKPVSELEIRNAWNAMLLNYEPERIKKLKQMRRYCRLVLLSNTNEVHYQCFADRLKEQYNITFSDLFDDVYLSHQMHLIKPDAAIFEQVLENEKKKYSPKLKKANSEFSPQRVLFVEDTAVNAQAAAQFGINTLVIERNGQFYDYFNWIE